MMMPPLRRITGVDTALASRYREYFTERYANTSRCDETYGADDLRADAGAQEARYADGRGRAAADCRLRCTRCRGLAFSMPPI